MSAETHRILRASRDDLLANHFTGTHTLTTMFYVYVLRSGRRKFYIGYSADLRRRIKEHQAKHVQTTKSASYKLIYYEAYKNKADAVEREIFLKSGSGHRFLKKPLVHYLAENIT